jgi:nicotinate dehydrogenase subunit B
MNAPQLTRRDVTGALAGIVVWFGFRAPPASAQQPAALPGGLAANPMLDAWLRINADGTATVFTGKAELGQGILTALAQIACEELDLPLARVQMVTPDTERSPNEGQTAGSQSVESSGTALRLAGAEARSILLELAGRRLGVEIDALSTENGVVIAPDGRRVGYGELAGEVNLKRTASARVEPKLPARHRIVGTSAPRLDIPAKVTGGAAFVQDLRLPSMLHGRVVRPPRYGAKLETLEADAINAMPGVVAVVRDGSFLGVLAAREEQAIKAREALAACARWLGGPELPDPARVHELLASMPSDLKVISEREAPLPEGAQLFEATYHRPYQAHASLSGSCAVAQLEDGKLTVWTHSQGVYPLRAELAKALGMLPSRICCIHAQGPGCYGHNGADDVALDAALLARATPGRPVRVQWMRDDEFMWEPYGPAMTMQCQAALAGGKIVDWTYEVLSQSHNMRPGDPDGVNLLASWHLATPHAMAPARGLPLPAGAGERNAIPLYELPRQRITHRMIKTHPVRTSALRTLGGYANVFAIESFIDELAAASGADPVEFRLSHTKDPRARAVIEAAATAAAWKRGERGDGERGRGLAFAKYKNSATYCAAIAEVEIERATGLVKVPRVWAAVDAGQVVNPDGLRNQIEGGVIQSTSWTLHEEVRFDPGSIQSRDWKTYPILTFPEAPKVETVLLDQPNERPLGAGEASQGPTAGAIANALANASGKRVRDLPFTPSRVKAVLAS